MEGEKMMMGDKCMTCKCPHHKVIPVLVILFGLTFLLGALNVISAYAVSVIWPILVLIGGFMKLYRCKCCCM